MGRFPQEAGKRGSQKWIQLAVNQAPPRLLDGLMLPSLDVGREIEWRSPLASDEFAEYRDKAFLQKIGAAHLSVDLENFWPSRGPQWDALGLSNGGHDILLVEAKAHINEIFSPASSASETSRRKIEDALAQTAANMGAAPRCPWIQNFYQLANRIAYLNFLRSYGLNAWLVLVNFVGDDEMDGPKTQQEWEAAYRVVWHVLGIPQRHAMVRYIIHCFPHISSLA